MTDENSNHKRQIFDIFTLFIGAASLILADNGVLRSFFGFILLAILIRELKKTSATWDRFIVSMSMAFAAIITCSYFLTSFLNAHGWALLEDTVLITGLISITIFFFVLKSKIERRFVRG
jgi:hypothetical protein